MAPTIFFKFSGYDFFKDFIRNPQTTIALKFLTHIISGIDGVGSPLNMHQSCFTRDFKYGLVETDRNAICLYFALFRLYLALLFITSIMYQNFVV